MFSQRNNPYCDLLKFIWQRYRKEHNLPNN
nr:MAG TPA: hypothetical protein [Caudoviricetes sp.]